MKKFGRLLTAMVTPFNAKGDVDYAQAKKLVKALLDSGSDGVVLAGSTGECPTLSHQEKLKLFSEVKSVVGDRGTVIAGTGNYSTAESIELTKDAERTGVDACMLVVPYYNRPTQDGLFEHFKVVAKATKLPCIVYNVPTRTVTNLAAETAIKLSQIDNIVGIKEASANFEQIAKVIKGVRSDFLVYSGNDGDTYPVLCLGGHGVISVASHLVGKQMKKMIEDFLKGDIKEAADYHHRLLPLVSALFIVSNPIPIKYALNHLGFSVGKPRLPLTEPDDKSKATIEQALKNYKIDLPI
ncbi:MAG: 4-hydroxy-tetrahydrodipicolinate synthase [Chloroflexi bacterium]|nr:4-hydroxy-tetrahydrodipicolinate synthase [Chloroflexota bacterium]MBM3154692.1 4-hydroxy-tetrahydrodipicolinate synthase [Chloroflexota bacterium]MBM3172431.1 4-hydroxy-tetrahydrodipicolinate synthase [Chloroflexota bacterium]MBM3175209.1 4-hydroxy-tetrahydrodipicolinate synthase [Chloroflexota bacterium]MBM4449946.1 4-hydroxy-tetrahydrodipicolinate synthase [Chloroflexota bacterium]